MTYVVTENPVIRQVSISGNEAISSDDIKEKLTITVGSTVDYPLLLENKQRIEAEYQAKGYYQAKVDYTLEPQGEGSVGFNFDVSEGKKLKLREVVFHGNHALSESDPAQGHADGLDAHVLWSVDNSARTPSRSSPDLDKIQRLYMTALHPRAVGEPEVSSPATASRSRST
jgi:outer membrane protein insertion porin family